MEPEHLKYKLVFAKDEQDVKSNEIIKLYFADFIKSNPNYVFIFTKDCDQTLDWQTVPPTFAAKMKYEIFFYPDNGENFPEINYLELGRTDISRIYYSKRNYFEKQSYLSQFWEAILWYFNNTLVYGTLEIKVNSTTRELENKILNYIHKNIKIACPTFY
jgi:hypothetical protein